MALTRLRKHQFIPFINTSKTADKNWARIGKSTVFSLAFNAKTEESDYIEDESNYRINWLRTFNGPRASYK